MEGVERAEARVSSSYFWPLRLLERMSSWATGMFRVLRRRTNTLDTLYRPHKSQFSRPYKTQRRRDQETSSSSVSSSEQRNNKYFGANNWRPVTNPDLMRTDRKPTTNSPDLTDRKDEIVNDTNYWKILPNFITSSGSKLRTYFWRHFPRILNRSSNGRLATSYPDLATKIVNLFFNFSGAGLLGTRQAWSFSVGGLGGKTRESTKPIHQNVSSETERYFTRSLNSKYLSIYSEPHKF